MVRRLLGPMLMTFGAAIQAGLMRTHYKILQSAGQPLMCEKSLGHPQADEGDMVDFACGSLGQAIQSMEAMAGIQRLGITSRCRRPGAVGAQALESAFETERLVQGEGNNWETPQAGELFHGEGE